MPNELSPAALATLSQDPASPSSQLSPAAQATLSQDPASPSSQLSPAAHAALSQDPASPSFVAPQQDTIDAATEAAAGVEAELGAAAPQAIEPLTTTALNTLAQTLDRVWDQLSQGHIDPPDVPKFTEDLDVMPQELFAPLAGLAAFLQQLPEAVKYQFDPEDLADSDDGLFEMTRLIGGLGRDKKVERALRRATIAPQEGAPSPARDAPEPDRGMAALL
ncbi:MAG: hypothetical protein GY788_21065 [bacterium]|nr:hypothetical protein [bacterium]